MNIDSHDGVVEFRVRARQYLVVLLLLVVQGVQALEEKLEDTSQVLWCRRCHEYIRETVYNSAGQGNAKSG